MYRIGLYIPHWLFPITHAYCLFSILVYMSIHYCQYADPPSAQQADIEELRSVSAEALTTNMTSVFSVHPREGTLATYLFQEGAPQGNRQGNRIAS